MSPRVVSWLLAGYDHSFFAAVKMCLTCVILLQVKTFRAETPLAHQVGPVTLFFRPLTETAFASFDTSVFRRQCATYQF